MLHTIDSLQINQQIATCNTRVWAVSTGRKYTLLWIVTNYLHSTIMGLLPVRTLKVTMYLRTCQILHTAPYKVFNIDGICRFSALSSYLTIIIVQRHLVTKSCTLQQGCPLLSFVGPAAGNKAIGTHWQTTCILAVYVHFKQYTMCMELQLSNTRGKKKVSYLHPSNKD